MTQEDMVRIKRVLSKIARANRLDLRVPLPVWDDTGTMIGVSLSCDKKMGAMDCRQEATFTLDAMEQQSDDKIAAKAELAAAALKATVLVSIKQKRQEKAA